MTSVTTNQDADEDDRVLGTVVKLLYRRGHHKAFSALLAAESVTTRFSESDPEGWPYHNVVLTVDIDRLDEYDDKETLKHVEEAYDRVWTTHNRSVGSVIVAPAL